MSVLKLPAGVLNLGELISKRTPCDLTGQLRSCSRATHPGLWGPFWILSSEPITKDFDFSGLSTLQLSLITSNCGPFAHTRAYQARGNMS
jgi:hypothetical protein